MDEEKTIMRNFPMNAVRLCIDHYEDDIQGRLYNKMSPKELSFQNCSEMLLKTDALFDHHGYPQTFQEKRIFYKEKEKQGKHGVPKEAANNATIEEQRGRYCTLDMIILSRRCAGWQGILLYTDGTEAARFQSEMELLEHIWKILADTDRISDRPIDQENKMEEKQ